MMPVHFLTCQRTLKLGKISVSPTVIVLVNPVWPEPCDIYFLNTTYNFTTCTRTTLAYVNKHFLDHLIHEVGLGPRRHGE